MNIEPDELLAIRGDTTSASELMAQTAPMLKSVQDRAACAYAAMTLFKCTKLIDQLLREQKRSQPPKEG